MAAFHAGDHGQRDFGHAQLGGIDGDDVVTMLQQFEHPAETTLAVDETDRSAELVMKAARHVTATANLHALCRVIKCRIETARVRSHQLPGKMEVAGHNDATDFRPLSQSIAAVELGVDMPVVASPLPMVITPTSPSCSALT